MLSSRNSFLLPMDSDWVFNRKTVNHFHPTIDECLNHGNHCFFEKIHITHQNKDFSKISVALPSIIQACQFFGQS